MERTTELDNSYWGEVNRIKSKAWKPWWTYFPDDEVSLKIIETIDAVLGLERDNIDIIQRHYGLENEDATV